jgi:hypothetical protein
MVAESPARAVRRPLVTSAVKCRAVEFQIRSRRKALRNREIGRSLAVADEKHTPFESTLSLAPCHTRTTWRSRAGGGLPATGGPNALGCLGRERVAPYSDDPRGVAAGVIPPGSEFQLTVFTRYANSRPSQLPSPCFPKLTRRLRLKIVVATFSLRIFDPRTPQGAPLLEGSTNGDASLIQWGAPRAVRAS